MGSGLLGRMRYQLRGSELRAAFGVIATVLAIFVGVRLWQEAQITRPVVVVSTAIERGALVESSALGVTEVRITGDAGALVVPGDAMDTLVGRYAQRELRAGVLLAADDVADHAPLAPGEGRVAVPLLRTATPPELASGDWVRVVVSRDGASTMILERVLVRQLVMDPFVATLQMPIERVDALVDALVHGRITVVLLPPPEP